MVNYEYIDSTDKGKSIAYVILDGEKIIVEFWFSFKKYLGEDFDQYILAEAHKSIGNLDYAIEILTPLSSGENNFSIKEELNDAGILVQKPVGSDTRNWAKKWIDENQ
jgi:hypothetical protein